MGNCDSVKCAILACCASNRYMLDRDPSLREVSLRYYTQAVRQVNRVLTTSDWACESPSDHLLTTVIFLYINALTEAVGARSRTRRLQTRGWRHASAQTSVQQQQCVVVAVYDPALRPHHGRECALPGVPAVHETALRRRLSNRPSFSRLHGTHSRVANLPGRFVGREQPRFGRASATLSADPGRDPTVQFSQWGRCSNFLPIKA